MPYCVTCVVPRESLGCLLSYKPFLGMRVCIMDSTKIRMYVLHSLLVNRTYNLPHWYRGRKLQRNLFSFAAYAVILNSLATAGVCN